MLVTVLANGEALPISFAKKRLSDKFIAVSLISMCVCENVMESLVNKKEESEVGMISLWRKNLGMDMGFGVYGGPEGVNSKFLTEGEADITDFTSAEDLTDMATGYFALLDEFGISDYDFLEMHAILADASEKKDLDEKALLSNLSCSLSSSGLPEDLQKVLTSIAEEYLKDAKIAPTLRNGKYIKELQLEVTDDGLKALAPYL